MWKVIIIDDDQKVCDGLERIIEKSSLNFTVVGKAQNGLDGYKLAKKENPDLVITDIYMPKSNGIEMIQALRNENIKSEVVILSGYAEFKHARDALRLNIRDYLSKPASRKTLISCLTEIDSHLSSNSKESKDLMNFEKQIKTYSKNIIEDLLQNSVKHLVNEKNLTTSQQRIINNWSQHYYLPIKFNFSLDSELWIKYSNLMIHFGIDNILNELFQPNQFNYYYVIIDASNFILFLESDDSSHLTDSSIHNIESIITDTLNKLFKTSFSSNRGEISNDWYKTIYSIQQLLSNFEYDIDSDVILTINKKLADAIKRMNIQEVKEIIIDFFEEIKVNNYLYVNEFNIALEIFTVFKYELDNINIDIYEYVEEDNLLHTFLSFISWDDMKAFFLTLIENVENEPVFEDNIKHTKLVQEVIEYVDDNIQKRFTLNEIADELFISRNYLGKIFKEKMNMTFNEYVTKTRIEKARKKLITGDYMIYEVAHAVGFDNPAYFTSVFKRIMGYSPSKLLQDKPQR
ncbi:response regulator [Alkalibacterium iburiense]|uniref:Response regulator n=1 Tax=Alkalibacterium iburiense TaxID=290589 RepID=A0ABP3GW73_9LACT